MTGWIIYGGIAGLALVMGVTALVAWYKGERLDAELTAYVAAGSMSAETAKSVLATAATTARKREIAALIAEGMDPAKGLILLTSMAAA